MKTITMAALFAVFAVAQSQWSAIPLNDRGAVYGVTSGLQAGAVGPTTNAHIWLGTPVSMTNIHPAGYSISRALAAAVGIQAGYAVINTVDHAGVWRGTAESWVDLHPAKAQSSQALSVHGDWTAGYAVIGGERNAYAWLNHETPVSLHPSGATRSVANATHGGIHGGNFDGRAALFEANPLTVTDLHPFDAVVSDIRGMYDDVQVGYYSLEQPRFRAAMWSGSSNSLVDLHPGPFHVSSFANAVSDGIQAGIFGEHAAVWYGSHDTFEDLSDYMGSQYLFSEAHSVHREGDTVTVGGRAIEAGAGFSRPIIWVSKYVAPTSFTMFRGAVVSGGLAELNESDDQRLIMRPGPVFGSTEAPIQIDIVLTAPVGFHDPDSFGFTLESSVSFGQGVQQIQFYSDVYGRYLTMDQRPTSVTERTTLVNVFESDQYIENVTGILRVRVMFKPTGPVFAYPWQARIDLARLRLPGAG